jgi:PIN domain nuclease of toxin-antitoxin system
VILLDTHVWVWLAIEPKRLSRPAAAAIRKATASGGISIAAISLWELAMLFALGRLRAAGTVETSVRSVVEKTGVIIHEISSEIAALATMFPESYPQDSAHRLIGATARSLGLALVTRDQRMLESKLLKTLW